MIFDTEEDAEDYTCDLNSWSNEGKEILIQRSPWDYAEDYGQDDKYICCDRNIVVNGKEMKI